MDFDLILVTSIALVVVALGLNVAWLVQAARKRAWLKPHTSNIFLALLAKGRFILLGLAMIGLAGYILFQAYNATPSIQTSNPLPEKNWANYETPIVIVFNIPIDATKVKPILSRSELEGDWVYEPYLPFLEQLGVPKLTRVAKFYPRNTLLPDERLVVYVTSVSRITAEESHEHALNFFTPKLAEVYSTTPGYLARDVDVSARLDYKFDRELTDDAIWEFAVVPRTDIEAVKTSSNSYQIVAKGGWQQSTNYVVSVQRSPILRNRSTGEVLSREEAETIHRLEFNTVKAPLIRKFTPSGTGVLEDSVIKIVFDVPMVKEGVESSFRISPNVTGTFTWRDNRTLIFTPDAPLAKDTEYVVTFPAGLEASAGGTSELEIRQTFRTIGPVMVTGMTPGEGTTRVSRRNLQVKVTFDQEVDHVSAQDHFRIEPAVSGTFTWEGNIMTFNANQELNYSTRYTAKVLAGVKTVYGLDSVQEFTTSFTTVPNQTIIPGFAWDHQDYTFSCGVASAKMILAWKGFAVSEDTIMNQMGRWNQAMVWGGGLTNPPTSTWADPNKVYVGDPNGNGVNGPGKSAYGVHWEPVKRIFRDYYGITSEVKRNWNAVALAHEIELGHPVQIWWFNGVSNYHGLPGTTKLYWKDKDTGATVEALNGMHSIVIYGFTGEADNPTSFLSMDPWFGNRAYPISQFNYQWQFLNNTAVVVY